MGELKTHSAVKLGSCLLVLVLTACLPPSESIIKLDEETRIALEERVTIYGTKDLKELEHKRLGKIEGISCEARDFGFRVSREAAIDQLRHYASARGGNGMTLPMCGKLDMSMEAQVRTNCGASITCHAEAISMPKSSLEALAKTPRTSAVGSGFVVSREGHLLTTQHVVGDCKKLNAQIADAPYEARVLAEDQGNNLVLLRAQPIPTASLSFRKDAEVRAGDSVVAMGFPVAEFRSSEPHVAGGVITSPAALQGKRRSLEMSAALQPGDSGGPVFDQSGHVVGIIISSADPANVGTLVADPRQARNVVLNARVAQAFLKANSVKFETAVSDAPLAAVDMFHRGKAATAALHCFR